MAGVLRRGRMLGTMTLAGALVLTGCGNGDGGDDGDVGATTDDQTTGTDDATAASGCEGVDLSTPPDEPVAMSLGRGPSSEEPLYVLAADPELAGAEHANEWYGLEVTEYSPPDRLAAFQAGELVGGTTSTPQLFTAASSGVPLAAVASIANINDDGGYTYPFLTMPDSGIESPKDLEGTQIGIIAPNTATEYWAKSAVASAGLDPTRDAEYVAIPPPNAGQALASGQVDVMMLTRSFDQQVRDEHGAVEVFDALTGPGFDHEFLVLFLGTEFIDQNPEATCAFLSDYQTAMNNWIENPEPMAQLLVDEGLVGAPTVEAFLSAPDDGRTDDAAINMDNLQQLIDSMEEVGFYEEPLGISAEDLVVPGVSLTE